MSKNLKSLNHDIDIILSGEKLHDEGYEPKVRGKKMFSFMKRLFDILSSGSVLLVFGWFILLLMLIKLLEDIGGKSYKIIIKQDDKGKYVSKIDGKRYSCKVMKDPNGGKDPTVHGAIYTSERVGKDGKLFHFHKIRSMCPGAEAMKEQLVAAGINDGDDFKSFKIKDDPRITKFGRFLRKTSLDELPQIWDIFVGNMSVVGPRSPVPEDVESFTSYQRHMLDVKGGLLCVWQIQHDRNKLTFDQRTDLNIAYIEHCSIGVDLYIIFKGFWFVLTDHSGE